MRSSKPWALVISLVLGLAGCSSPAVDLKEMRLLGLALSPHLTPQEVIHVLSRPEEEEKSPRWLWRPPRLHMKYYRQGLELAFDSETKTYDPITSRFFRAYIFLRVEGKYGVFAGKISHGIHGDWDLARLEKAMGPPEKTQPMGEELEWIYGERNPFQTVFIAHASDRKLKAIMIIRRDRERPV